MHIFSITNIVSKKFMSVCSLVTKQRTLFNAWTYEAEQAYLEKKSLI